MARVKVVVTAPYARPGIENYRRRLEAAGCDALCRTSLIPAVR